MTIYIDCVKECVFLNEHRREQVLQDLFPCMFFSERYSFEYSSLHLIPFRSVAYHY